MNEFKDRAREFAIEKGFNSIYRNGNEFYFIGDSLHTKNPKGDVEKLIGDEDIRVVFVPPWKANKIYKNAQCLLILNKC